MLGLQWNEREVTLDQLRPYERNPRKISDAAYKNLVQSLRDNGYHQRIIATQDLRVIGGHQRIKALKEIGLTKIRVLTPNMAIPDEQFRKMLVQDNLPFGDFDLDMLMTDYKRDELLDWGMPEEWLGKEKITHSADEDAVPDIASVAVTKMGNTWLMGEHRVMCGDSTDAKAIALLMGGKKADMVFTDPPYGVNIVNVGTNKVGGGGPTKFKTASVGGGKIVDAKQYAPIIGDHTTETAKKFYAACLEAGIKNYIIFGGNYFTDFLPPKSCWVVWDKQNTGNFADVELAWTSNNGGAKLYSHLWNGLARKGNHKTELSTRVHPTQKPVGLFESIFADFKFKSCFDGFLGSGSTLIACEKQNRICYGMELSPEYCDVIVKRWEQFTGKKAILESTGAPFAEAA